MHSAASIPFLIVEFSQHRLGSTKLIRPFSLQLNQRSFQKNYMTIKSKTFNLQKRKIQFSINSSAISSSKQMQRTRKLINKKFIRTQQSTQKKALDEIVTSANTGKLKNNNNK